MGRLIDREKVIESVDICRGKGHCEDCRYYQGHAGYTIMDCRKYLLNDVLAMLKDQEAVEPILVREGWNKYHNNYVCPRCDNDVFYEQNYCLECGVRFLWEGR